MAQKKRVSDDVLIESYNRLKNVWLVGKEVGICGQSVHERVVKLGIVVSDFFTNEEIILLKENYEAYASTGRLKELCLLFKNRDRHTLCRAARRLGLTIVGRPKKNYISFEKWKLSSKDRWKTHPHPRGYLGHTHSKETLYKMSQKSFASQRKINEEGRRPVIVKKAFEKKMERYGTIAPPRSKVSWKQGWRIIGGVRKYYRSSWEANYARFLQTRVENLEIKSWEYECFTFWFKDISDNIVSYRPDFKIVLLNDLIEYHEVKGWYDSRSVYKLNKLKNEFPEIVLLIIDKHWFLNNRNLQTSIEGWEKINKY